MMFMEYFGLIEQPFGVTPDPRFLHLGPKHREALASLVYGAENNRGFLALIAPPGMGKTSLLFHYLEGVRSQARTVFLFQAAADSRDLMRYLLADLGLDATGADLPGMHEMLNQVLTEEMRAGRRLILVIDEAQNLDERVLESIRLLSNFETPWMKLMQIVMAGQPQLAERLARPSMSQLRQRISSIIRLDPFTTKETNAYIDHRLWVAGYAGPPLFTVGARLLIGQHSGGIPRNINNLCFHSMALASSLGKKQVDSQMVSEAVSDLSIEPSSAKSSRPWTPSAGPTLVPFHPSPTRKSAGRPLLSPPSSRASKFIPAMVITCAVLFLGLVSGATWKTDAGSIPSAATPTANAAAFPVLMTPSGKAPETLPSQSTSPSREAVTVNETPESLSPVQATQDQRLIAVSVPKGATLRHLSLVYLDRFDQPTLTAIRLLNPAITDPNHLEANQRILLPLYLRRDVLKAASADGISSSIALKPEHAPGEAP
jgi:type II secretory pathway predicted ATPase ExeA